MKFGLKFTLKNRLYYGKIPAKIPAKNKIPAGTGTGTKSPNPGRDPGCAGIPVELCSHDLAIECGRYSNTPRELRTCHWCKSCMGTEILEDENHVMHECDLYSDIRAKLIARLRNALYIQTQSESNNLLANPYINNQTLKSNIMTLLSPYTVPDIDHIGTNLFNIHRNRPKSF